MNLILALGMDFDKWSWSVILSAWSLDFFWKCILVCKLYIVLLPNLFRPNVNFIAGDISSKKLHIREYF